MRISKKAGILLLAGILITGSLPGCHSPTSEPATQQPTTFGESTERFSVISHDTQGRVWLFYVDAFKDEPSTWSEIRSYALSCANELHAGNGQVAVAFYFFDTLNGVDSPAVVDNFWNVPGEDPHCVASFSMWRDGSVVAWKYPFVDSKADPL